MPITCMCFAVVIVCYIYIHATRYTSSVLTRSSKRSRKLIPLLYIDLLTIEHEGVGRFTEIQRASAYCSQITRNPAQHKRREFILYPLLLTYGRYLHMRTYGRDLCIKALQQVLRRSRLVPIG